MRYPCDAKRAMKIVVNNMDIGESDKGEWESFVEDAKGKASAIGLRRARILKWSTYQMSEMSK